MEAEKSYSLLSVAWRTRRASGVILFSSEDLRTRGANGVSSSPRLGADGLSPGLSQRLDKQERVSERRERWVSQLKQRKNLYFLCLYVLFISLASWMMPNYTGESNLYSVYQFRF